MFKINNYFPDVAQVIITRARISIRDRKTSSKQMQKYKKAPKKH